MILTRDELTKIVEFMVKFPQADSVNIESDSSSGIGSIITVEIPLNLEDVDGVFKVQITDISAW